MTVDLACFIFWSCHRVIQWTRGGRWESEIDYGHDELRWGYYSGRLAISTFVYALAAPFAPINETLSNHLKFLSKIVNLS